GEPGNLVLPRLPLAWLVEADDLVLPGRPPRAVGVAPPLDEVGGDAGLLEGLPRCDARIREPVETGPPAVPVAVILQLRIPAPVEVAEQDGQRGPLGVGRVGRLRSLVPGSGALGFQGDPEAGVSGAGLVADLGVREPGGDFPSVVVAGGDLQTLEIVRNVRIVLVLYGAHVGDHGGGVVRVVGLLERAKEEPRIASQEEVVVRPHLRLVVGGAYRIRDLHDLLHGDGGRMSEDLAGRLQPGEGVPPLAGDGLNGLGALHWSLLSFPAAVCAACAGAGHAWRRTPAALA